MVISTSHLVDCGENRGAHIYVSKQINREKKYNALSAFMMQKN